MRRLPGLVLLAAVCGLLPGAFPAGAGGGRPTAPRPPAAAESGRAPDFRPDPAAAQRYGPAYRYPQAGWIVLHIEGEPYERGVQHGRLLAPEIAAHVRCFAATQSPKSPTEGWKQTRTLVNALFLRRYDKE